RLDDLEGFHVYHRDVATNAVGGQQLAFVGIEGHVPDASSYQQIVEHFIGFGIDHGDMVSRAEGDEGVLAVGAELDTHRLNAVGVHALDGEVQSLDDLPLLHIHHADSAADLRGGPENLAVLGELDMAWALIDQGVVHQLVGGGVDPVQHVGGFAGVHRPLAVGADGHAFGLDADFDLRQNCTVFH